MLLGNGLIITMPTFGLPLIEEQEYYLTFRLFMGSRLW